MSISAITWAMEQQPGDPTRKLILIVLADHCGHDGGCWPSQDRIAEMCGVSDRTVRRHLEALERDGYIVRALRTRPNGSQGSDRVYLQLPPEKIEEDTGPYEPKPATSLRMRRSLLELFGSVCWYCGERGEGDTGPDGETFHVDRILPGAQGGTYHPDNRALACSTCNKAKHARTPQQWQPGTPVSEIFAVKLPTRVLAFIESLEAPRHVAFPGDGVDTGVHPPGGHERPPTSGKRPEGGGHQRPGGGGHGRPGGVDAGVQGGRTPASTLEPSVNHQENRKEEPAAAAARELEEFLSDHQEALAALRALPGWTPRVERGFLPRFVTGPTGEQLLHGVPEDYRPAVIAECIWQYLEKDDDEPEPRWRAARFNGWLRNCGQQARRNVAVAAAAPPTGEADADGVQRLEGGGLLLPDGRRLTASQAKAWERTRQKLRAARRSA